MNKKRACPERSRRGFTLIELLVVISIIGVLTTLILANLSDARSRARDAVKKSELTQLKTALRLYYNDNQKYPINQATIGTSTFTSGTTIYMKKLPAEFTYTQIDDDSFTLSVPLENASDADLATSQITCLDAADGSLNFYACSD